MKTTTTAIKCVSNKTIMQMFPLSMLITLLLASSFIIPCTDGRSLPETTTIESEIEDLGTEETTTVIATTEANVSPNLQIDEVKTFTRNTNESASVIDPFAEESNDIKEDSGNIQNSSNDANTFPQFDIDLLNAKSLEDSIRKEVANTIEFDQRPPTALHVVDEEPAPEFRIIGQMQADDPSNIESKDGDEEVLSSTTVSPNEDSSTEPIFDEEPTEEDYETSTSLIKKKGKTSLPDTYTTVGIKESTPEKTSEIIETSSNAVVTINSELVADIENSSRGKAATTKDASLESTVSERTTVTIKGSFEEDSSTQNKTTCEGTKVGTIESTSNEESSSYEKTEGSSTPDNTINNNPALESIVGKVEPEQYKTTNDASVESTVSEEVRVSNKASIEDDSRTSERETKVGTIASTSNEENSTSEKNKTSSTSENTINNIPALESIVGTVDPEEVKTPKDVSLAGTATEGTTMTNEDNREHTTTENKTTNDKETNVGTHKSTSSEETEASSNTEVTISTKPASEPIVGQPDPLEGSIGKDETTKDVSLESTIKKGITFTNKDSSEEDSSTENKISNDKETKIGTNESTSSEENSSEDSSENNERSSTEGILNDGETLNSKDAQAVSQVHDSDAKPSNAQNNPLNADTNVGNDKPTINSNSNTASAFIPTIIACIGLVIGIVIAIIHLIIKRQHGTLDIELQEKRCGKDDLNEEASDTHTKLLNVDLPIPTETTALTSAEKNDDCL